jgi:hemerythrin
MEAHMPFLLWDKSFELGVGEFDDHHKHLLALLNNTYDHFLNRSNDEVTEAVIDKLIDYATYHFSAEEYWMELHGYKGLILHREEHNKFTRRVREIQRDFYNGRTQLTLEIMSFLANWLTSHILTVDGDYGKFAKTL